MGIVVVGSLNLDRFYAVARLPRPGETIVAHATFQRFGGKGANQAVAAARLGARVALIGAVGDDAGGSAYVRRLRDEGIAVAAVACHERTDTGSAVIAVETSGENQIIVSPGANARLTPGHLRAHRGVFAGARVVLLQNEVPRPVVLEALRLAAEAGAAVVYNPSPWQDDFPWAEVTLHTVLVNQREGRAWLGEPRFPAGGRIERVVLTQGRGPTLGLTAAGTVTALPPSVTAVDTVGAGDAFAGAYAVALAEAQPLERALAFANAAGALATQQPGAQEALPSRAGVERLLQPRPSTGSG